MTRRHAGGISIVSGRAAARWYRRRLTMIVTFVFPSSHHRTGGVMMLYEFSNALARRGHTVHFLHGPRTPHRISTLDELPPFDFHPDIQHRIIDSFEDPGLPEGDIVFSATAPDRLGLPCSFVQGHQMLSPEWEHAAYRGGLPKVCIAKWLVEVGRTYGVPDEELWHVPYGLDHRRFVRTVPLDERPVDVAMLSHPHPEKGWPTGLAALDILSAQREDFRAIVFGINPPRGPLPAGVEAVVGADHRRLVDEVYNRTKVFMQVSRVEGFGLTPVEAMACGTALVTTDNGGSRDYAVPGETALVVEPEDSSGLAAAVSSLLDDDARRVRMAEAAEAYVRRFDWDRSGELLEAHLVRYLDDPSAFRREPSAEAALGETDDALGKVVTRPADDLG